MADIYGTDGDDILDYSNATPNPPQSNQTNQTIYGLAGNDTIIAGPPDEVRVSAPTQNNPTRTQLIVDNDTIIGGPGDDTMTGGYGNDTFVFTFSVTEEIIRYSFWDYADNPAQQANLHAWNNAYAAWVAYMNSLGADFGSATAGALQVNWNGKSKTFTQTFTASDTDATLTKLTVTGEGNDTITDWGNGNDKLKFFGLSLVATDVNYWDAVLDSHQSGGNTVITFGGGSITLVGVLTTIEDLVGTGSVLFG